MASSPSSTVLQGNEGLVKPVIPGGDYGACQISTELDDMIPADNLSSLALFTKSWILLAPLLGPIFFIIALNFAKPHDLTMECEFRHTLAVEFACSATLPAVRIFPRFAISLGILLLAWRMVHERAYYILMSNRVMIDFQIGKRFGHWTIVCLAALFTLSLIHFFLKFFAGHPCPGGLDNCELDKYMLNNTLLELFCNPYLLYDARNKHAKEFLDIAILQFVMPSALCLTTLGGLLNLEAELMPLSKMLEVHPRKVYHHLGTYVFVPESMIRQILRKDLGIGADSAECTIEQFCTEVHKVALEEACMMLGSGEEDPTAVEKMMGAPVMRDRQEKDLSVSEGFAELCHLDWWPTKLLLGPNLTGEACITFKRLMGLHFVAALVLIVMMEVLALIRVGAYLHLVVTNVAYSHTAVLPLLMLSTEVFFESSWVLQSHRLLTWIYSAS
jgi:hypothetical protein